MKPNMRPARPEFSSGPCAKRPGWTPEILKDAAVGRTHRSRLGKKKIVEAVDRTRALLGIPADYRLAIVPGMLFKAVIGICDATLAELRRAGRHPVPQNSMTVREAFRRVGADEWDAVSERCKPSRAEAAE